MRRRTPEARYMKESRKEGRKGKRYERKKERNI